jgi:uncharacterized protein YndB with AHSA1/START domain
MTMTASDNTSTADREIVISRVVEAPRELVWQAWTQPEHVAQWWGPNGFTSTIQEMDVRVGGVFRMIMHGMGQDFPNVMTYLEVVEPERLVYDHGNGEAGDPNQFHVTVTFAEQDGKTEVTMRSLFATPEARDYVAREFGAIEGGRQHLARLAEHLAQMQA